MMTVKLFFSHSLTIYNTPIENICLKALAHKYPDYEIINPRDIKVPDDFKEAMKCLLPIIRKCDILVYFKDDSYSPGVDMEITKAKSLDIPVFNLQLWQVEADMNPYYYAYKVTFKIMVGFLWIAELSGITFIVLGFIQNNGWFLLLGFGLFAGSLLVGKRILPKY